jgi:hypothetical protein
MSYHRLYDSAVLDDIHNYFPDLLYAPERFRSVPDLLAYVQHQARQRFDLFSRGRREYMEQERRQTISTPPLRSRVLFEANHIHPMTSNPSDFLQAINLMTGLIGATATATAVPQPDFMEPVTVRPTAEQIQSATAIEIVDSEEEMCAVCQDTLQSGTEALNLIACDHRFHSGCINTWFMSHVVCPVCRHDIREPSS